MKMKMKRESLFLRKLYVQLLMNFLTMEGIFCVKKHL